MDRDLAVPGLVLLDEVGAAAHTTEQENLALLADIDALGQSAQQRLDEMAQLRAIHGVIGGNRGMSVETQVPVDGEQRWHRTSVQPIRDADGQAVAALINATDIHDLKAAQRELQDLNQTLEARVRERELSAALAYCVSSTQ